VVQRRGRSTIGPQRCPNLPRFGSRGSGEGAPRWPAVARQAAALQAEERRRGTLGLGKNRAAVAVELGEGSAGSFIGGQVGGGGSGAGERDGTRRRVADGPVRGSSMGGPRGGALGKRRPRAGGAVPQSPALCARLVTAPCRLGAAQLRRARACAVVARAASGARPGGRARGGGPAGPGALRDRSWAQGRRARVESAAG